MGVSVGVGVGVDLDVDLGVDLGVGTSVAGGEHVLFLWLRRRRWSCIGDGKQCSADN